ncbi:hypothetical protein MKZ38_000568 [Zalerion maritima]|uniref:Telomere-associated protein Rif1 N-terminal domain-containing protein n=1 Tax=Zalerion maritima TaxID=339359 RepID=A0AAD5RRD7_9PEZI|nr:hypothetical protein MKZ38_000568 [Zalerion maritima]
MGSEELIVNTPTVPLRPPTPPKEKLVEQSGISILADVKNLQQPTIANTFNTPPSAQSFSSLEGSRIAKRVGFSGQAQYFTNEDAAKKQSTPRSASSTLPKPARSILKKTDAPIINLLDSSKGSLLSHAEIADMLESTVQQLAGGNRQSKIDAYRTLHECFRGSNNLPDRIALQSKMSLYTQFIQRDLRLGASTGTLDSQLVVSALNLLSTFLMYPAIASQLTQEFSMFFIEHCITAFRGPENLTYTKDVIKRLMHAIHLSDFSSKVMTADRVGRLVAVLHNIESKWTGKGILHTRMAAYQTLMRQSRQHMIAHPDWLEDLFEDMLSIVKEIRQSAIKLGFEAAYANTKDRSLSRKVHELLASAPEGQTYQHYFVQSLLKMVKGKGDQSASVPQIWSVAILLLRIPFEKWNTFPEWLKVIQQCFNSGNFTTRKEANLAWSRFVYASHLSASSFTKQLPTLIHPLVTQLTKKPGSKAHEEVRKVVYGAACMLLYYALKPTLTPNQMDEHWKLAAVPILKQLISFKAVPEGVEHATRILSSLFDNTTQRLWREELVAEVGIVAPEQLPPLDPKWIRRHSASIFELVGPALKHNFVELDDRTSQTHKLWKSLVGSVQSVVVTEIKVSTDTAAFVAGTFNVLLDIWNSAPRGLSSDDVQVSPKQFLNSVSAFLDLLILSLGNLTFTEKLLSMNPPTGLFAPIQTPSHRSTSKHKPVARSPLHHLFALLTIPSLPNGLPDDGFYADFLMSTFGPFFNGKNVAVKRNLAYSLLQIIPGDVPCPYGAWALAANVIIGEMQNSQGTNHSTNSDILIGNEYRELVKLLFRGLRWCPNIPWEVWRGYYDIVAEQIVEEAGDSGRGLALVEPLAKQILSETNQTAESLPPTNIFNTTARLLSTSTQPRDEQALDTARRKLWGTTAGTRSRTPDPFDHLYILINFMLLSAYHGFDHYDTDEIVIPLLVELSQFLSRCSDALAQRTLIRLQKGMAEWIRDDQARVNSRTSSKLAQVVKELWERVCSRLSSQTPDLLQLVQIEPLFLAAFESKHQHVVNSMSLLWNMIYEQAESISWPAKLKDTLLALRVYCDVDVVLPGVDLSSIESGHGQKPSFIETQDDLNMLELPGSKPSEDEITPKPSVSPVRSSSPVVRFPVPSHSTRSTPHSRGAARGAASRLRHDDSQVHFTAIPSSSPNDIVLDSQLMTNRQKEVRDRQRETSALYKEVQSSPEPDEPGLPKPNPDEPARACQRITTPDRHARRDDFVSSTPTPRRGQLVNMIDTDNDPPSSPPEPRRFPLLPDMSSRSRSGSIMEDWPFSSSPTNGSPVAGPRKASPVLGSSQDIAMEIPDDMVSNHELDTPNEHEHPAFAQEPEEEQATENYASSMDVDMESEDDPTPKRSQVVADKSPPRITTPKPVESVRTESDIFEGAISSPRSSERLTRSSARAAAQPAPSPSQLALQPKAKPEAQPQQRLPPEAIEISSKDTSFQMSYIDEASMTRLAIEIESKPIDKSKYLFVEPTPSPEKQCNQLQQQQSPLKNKCIVVQPPAHWKSEYGPEPDAKPDLDLESQIALSQSHSSQRPRRGRPRRSQTPADSQDPSIAPTTPVDVVEVSSQPSQKKRKRSTPLRLQQECSTAKRRRSSRVAQQKTPEPRSATMANSVERRGLFSAGKKLWQGLTGALADFSQSTTTSEHDEKEREEEDESSVSGRVSESEQEKDAEPESGQELPAPVPTTSVRLAKGSRGSTTKSAVGFKQEMEQEDVEVETELDDSTEQMQVEQQLRGSQEGMTEPIGAPRQAGQPEEDEESADSGAQSQAQGENIMTMLRGGLEGLKAAALSRNEVYEIESMFMDIKRELYEAERRGREARL